MSRVKAVMDDQKISKLQYTLKNAGMPEEKIHYLSLLLQASATHELTPQEAHDLQALQKDAESAINGTFYGIVLIGLLALAGVAFVVYKLSQ